RWLAWGVSAWGVSAWGDAFVRGTPMTSAGFFGPEGDSTSKKQKAEREQRDKALVRGRPTLSRHPDRLAKMESQVVCDPFAGRLHGFNVGLRASCALAMVVAVEAPQDAAMERFPRISTAHVVGQGTLGISSEFGGA
ncbi:MAG: hypothetical protein AB7O66_21175, partial [Limisphaerales bacterium]